VVPGSQEEVSTNGGVMIALGILGTVILFALLFSWYGRSAFDQALVEGGAGTPSIPRRRRDGLVERTEALF